ncbi:hypothetical protein [Thermococcus sp. 21S7]|uniref:hypothetical protein n=1 Tax=Thermococcus sp. 21S7 TaxID=1638221 RepID=UPI00143C29C2|nr:hypothetical protein [Thermococcus sp. 21S7]NJE62580.1 hypothetical protein [Thermococcus sp. 21S7]
MRHMPVYEIVITVGFENDKIVWEDVFRYVAIADTPEEASEFSIKALPEQYSEMILKASVRELKEKGVICKGWPP